MRKQRFFYLNIKHHGEPKKMNIDKICKVCKNFNRDNKHCKAFNTKLKPDTMAREDCSDFVDLRLQFEGEK